MTILTLFMFSFRGYIAYILDYPCSGKVSYVRRRSAIAYVSQTTVLVEIGSRKDSCFSVASFLLFFFLLPETIEITSGEF